MTKKESIFILFSITLCWSSSYIFIKDIPQSFSVYAYLALTSGVAGIILALVMRRKFRLLNKVSLRQGLILGVLITLSNMFEKLGLDQIPASSASVYASMGIIIVPLILLFKKQYPSRNNIAGIAVILIGIFVSNWGTMGGAGLLGALYILGSATAMSMYTVLATEYTKETDPSLLTVLQMIVSAVAGFGLWMATDAGSLFTIEWSQVTLSYIFLIAFFSKCYAYLMLMYADKYADAVSVTIVASTEPVVTLVAAVLLPESMGGVEQFSAKSVGGALIISLGAIIAGTNFLSKKEKAREEDIEERLREDVEADELIGEEMGFETTVRVLEGLEAAEAKDEAAAALLPFMPQAKNIFFLVAVMFGILSASINVMIFAGGYSQIRPVNAIPAPVGMVFGPVGALGCAIGNLLGDLLRIETMKGTVVLGFIANFLSAYIPYKTWRAMAGDVVNVHTWKKIGLFAWSAVISCMACALFLGFGLEVFFKQQFLDLVPLIFFNNLTFTIALGFPVLIVLTSSDFGLGAWVTLRLRSSGPLRMRGFVSNQWSPAICLADTVVMGITFFMIRRGIGFTGNPLMMVLGVLTIACILLTCMMQGKEANV